MIASASLHRLHAIDAKILDLLSERAALASDLDEEGEETPVSELVHWWTEEAVERGLDDEIVIEKACRAIAQLRK